MAYNENHSIIDNAFSLISSSQLTLSPVNGVYYSREIFNLDHTNLKYFEIGSFGNNSTKVPSFIINEYPFDSDYTNYNLRNAKTNNRINVNCDYESSGSHPIFDFKVGSYYYTARVQNNSAYSTSWGEPTRLGIAFNSHKLQFHYIYSATNVKVVYFEFAERIRHRTKLKFGYVRNEIANGGDVVFYIDQSTWIANANKGLDQIEVVYPDEDTLKQY